MKQIILVVLAFLAVNASLMASTADHFVYDQGEVENSMLQLNNLESFVNANEGITYAEVAADRSDLLVNISDIPFMTMTDGEKNPALGIPSFLWGCCFGAIGILIVYLVSEDTEETKKALWGCLASCVAYGVVYVAYWIFFLQYTSTYWY